jgi:hypothetical protein
MIEQKVTTKTLLATLAQNGMSPLHKLAVSEHVILVSLRQVSSKLYSSEQKAAHLHPLQTRGS